MRSDRQRATLDSVEEGEEGAVSVDGDEGEEGVEAAAEVEGDTARMGYL